MAQGAGVEEGTTLGSSSEKGRIEEGTVTGYTDVTPWHISVPRRISNKIDVCNKKVTK